MRSIKVLLLTSLLGISAVNAEEQLQYFCPADSSKDSHFVNVKHNDTPPKLAVIAIPNGGEDITKGVDLLSLEGKKKGNGSMVFGKEPFKSPYFYIPKNLVGISFNFIDRNKEEQSFTTLSCEKR